MGRLSILGAALILLATSSIAWAQKDVDNEPTSNLNFQILKDDNGKAVRNASVIMHPVNSHGKQERGDLELKTDPEGKANFEGIPYGTLRVQVLASGFQTYGEDFNVNRSEMTFTIKLKRPQGQYSIYENHSKDPDTQQKQDPPSDKKPN